MTGVVYVNKANVLDYEAGLEYTLAIRCTDDNLEEEQVPPHLYADQAITITINDANDPPEFYSVSLWSLSYEVYQKVTLYFTVRDNGGDPSNPSNPGLSGSSKMVVTVTDLNDPPVLACKTTPSACLFSVPENTGSGYVVGQIVGSDEDGESLTYSFVNLNGSL
jgi:hypothetical protein